MEAKGWAWLSQLSGLHSACKGHPTNPGLLICGLLGKRDEFVSSWDYYTVKSFSYSILNLYNLLISCLFTLAQCSLTCLHPRFTIEYTCKMHLF